MNQLAAISDFDHAGSHVFAAVGRGDEARTFRAAVRHSRQVRFLRIAIPVATAVAVLGGVAANSWFQPLRVLTKVPIELGSLVVSGTKITMKQPRLAGFTSDNRQYELTAQAASQDSPSPAWSSCKTCAPSWRCRARSLRHFSQGRFLRQPHRDAHPAAQHRGDLLGRLSRRGSARRRSISRAARSSPRNLWK